MPARGYCKRKEIRGIFKFAEVVPWCDWESQEGSVHTCVHCKWLTHLYTYMYMHILYVHHIHMYYIGTEASEKGGEVIRLCGKMMTTL